MLQHVLTRKHCIIAGEMGTGKSLAMIEMWEWIHDELGEHHDNQWYVGPVAGVKAVSREIRKWDSRVQPKMMTFEGMVKLIKNWKPGMRAPRSVVFDESSKLKTPTSQRSQMAEHLADSIRAEYGEEGFILEASGTPAPKTPDDWWNQCEIARPGFLKEGSRGKFKNRLCLSEMRESIHGGEYPHIITWLDDERKCAKCGQWSDAPQHAAINITEPDYCPFQASVNEVAKLNKRITSGLVIIVLKKDCLDLPDKTYDPVIIKPEASTLRTAKTIAKNAGRAITALTLMRELSDGFQYEEIPVGEIECPNCKGKGEVLMKLPDREMDPMAPLTVNEDDFKELLTICDYCGGEKVVPKMERTTQEVPCPKDDQLIEDLDTHEDLGRLIVWGGFTATLDRIVRICHQQGWTTLRVDGRGYVGTDPTEGIVDSDDLLDAMDFSHPRKQEMYDAHPKVCFIGHPKAGGMALTLTASPTEIFFSNSFDGEARMQAEDRFHRGGMDLECKPTIKDYLHLPSDKLVLNNLKKKKKLQDISMGEVQSAFTEGVET